MRAKHQQHGFTLIEVLVGLAILGILIGSFFRVVGNTVDSSTELSVRNEVVQDAQITQQIVNASLQEACYVYPTGTTITMAAGGWTTARSILGLTGNTWTVGTDPIIAMILPPNANDLTAANRPRYRFIAYFPIQRSAYIAGKAASSTFIDQLPNEPANSNNWVLMRYIRYLRTAPVDTTTPTMNPARTCENNATTGNADITGGSSDLLVDYVQPTFVSASNPLNYTMFSIATAAAPAPPSITFRLRMARTYRGTATIRVPGASAPPMQVTTAPQNNGL